MQGDICIQRHISGVALVGGSGDIATQRGQVGHCQAGQGGAITRDQIARHSQVLAAARDLPRHVRRLGAQCHIAVQGQAAAIGLVARGGHIGTQRGRVGVGHIQRGHARHGRGGTRDQVGVQVEGIATAGHHPIHRHGGGVQRCGGGQIDRPLVTLRAGGRQRA